MFLFNFLILILNNTLKKIFFNINYKEKYKVFNTVFTKDTIGISIYVLKTPATRQTFQEHYYSTRPLNCIRCYSLELSDFNLRRKFFCIDLDGDTKEIFIKQNLYLVLIKECYFEEIIFELKYEEDINCFTLNLIH